MTTTTRTPDALPIDTQVPDCGPDCICIDGACRCYEGESARQPGPQWMDDIVPPF